MYFIEEKLRTDFKESCNIFCVHFHLEWNQILKPDIFHEMDLLLSELFSSQWS